VYKVAERGIIKSCLLKAHFCNHITSSTKFLYIFEVQLSQYSVWLRTKRSRFDLRKGQRTFPLASVSGYGAHPASCTKGTGGTFPGGKARPGRDADHSPPSSAEVMNEELYLLSTLCIHSVLWDCFTFLRLYFRSIKLLWTVVLHVCWWNPVSLNISPLKSNGNYMYQPLE
jgi:hypothetical protein